MAERRCPPTITLKEPRVSISFQGPHWPNQPGSWRAQTPADEGHMARSWHKGQTRMEWQAFLGSPEGQTSPLRRLHKGSGWDSERPVLIQWEGKGPSPPLGWEHWARTTRLKLHEATCQWVSFSIFRVPRKKVPPLATMPWPAV